MYPPLPVIPPYPLPPPSPPPPAGAPSPPLYLHPSQQLACRHCAYCSLQAALAPNLVVFHCKTTSAASACAVVMVMATVTIKVAWGLVSAGPIDFRHAFLDMTNVEVKESPYTRAGRTCPAAMGFSFAAGTTDGMHATCMHTPLCTLLCISPPPHPPSPPLLPYVALKPPSYMKSPLPSANPLPPPKPLTPSYITAS